VSTYPPVTDRERDAALARIDRRHRERDDTHWSAAGLGGHSEAREVLEYLRRRHARIPVALAGHDVWDELVLGAWVYWDERRRERERLHRARRAGLSWSELGRYVGIGTRQGMRDYLDRLDAAVDEYLQIQHAPRTPATGDGATDPLARLAGTTRAQRGADVHAARAKRATNKARPARASWITTHHQQVTRVLTDLLEQTARAGIRAEPSDDHHEPDLGDYLSWLAEDLNTNPDGNGVHPATMATLGLALGELRDHPAVAAAAPNHGLRLALAAADQLRATYAEQAAIRSPGV
jgi:hypothetical protein